MWVWRCVRARPHAQAGCACVLPTDNGIGAEGAAALANALATNSSLQQLDLSSECRPNRTTCSCCDGRAERLLL